MGFETVFLFYLTFSFSIAKFSPSCLTFYTNKCKPSSVRGWQRFDGGWVDELARVSDGISRFKIDTWWFISC